MTEKNLKIAEIGTIPEICIKAGKLSKEELREKAEELVKLYNSQIQDGIMMPLMEYPSSNQNANSPDIVQIMTIIEDTINKYTAEARAECFEELKASKDPMLEAIKRLTFDTIKVTVKKESFKIPGSDENAEILKSKIEDSEKAIDLLKLHNSIEGGIGKVSNWNGYVERMNYHMTARQAKRLLKNKEHLTKALKEINNSYAMSDIARQIDMGKDPTSNTKLLSTLQSVVTAMIGDTYKVTSHDVNYLTDVYAKKGKKALTVNCANHSFFRAYIAAICHGIVTGEDYDLSYKKAVSK